MLQEDPKENAKRQNQKLIRQLEKRAEPSDAVLGPCLTGYKAFMGQNAGKPPIYFLENMTRWLLEKREKTEKLIRETMKARWTYEPDRIPSSVTNSLRRSAGTNYQALLSYALAQYLLRTESAWYVQQPVPKEFREALVIKFTGGIPTQSQSDDSAESEDQEDEEDAAHSPDVARVKPDVDILLRNASWDEQSQQPEPVVLLSVKTSLVDRAGMAARWKMYFDLATHPCPHVDKLGDCAYGRLGIVMENANLYHIHHAIVTANIYKYWFQDERYKQGELESGQTRSNTYMFELKFTTRDDDLAVTPSDWYQFPHITEVLAGISNTHGLLQ